MPVLSFPSHIQVDCCLSVYDLRSVLTRKLPNSQEYRLRVSKYRAMRSSWYWTFCLKSLSMLGYVDSMCLVQS